LQLVRRRRGVRQDHRFTEAVPEAAEGKQAQQAGKEISRKGKREVADMVGPSGCKATHVTCIYPGLVARIICTCKVRADCLAPIIRRRLMAF
jgi:hypothetical protein